MRAAIVVVFVSALLCVQANGQPEEKLSPPGGKHVAVSTQNTPNTDLTNVAQMSPQYVWWLSILGTTAIVVMWVIFWIAVWHRKESITEILVNPSFFKIITVMGVIAATVILSLADRLPGNLTGAILSGIVGYVLGSVAGNGKRQTLGADKNVAKKDKEEGNKGAIQLK